MRFAGIGALGLVPLLLAANCPNDDEPVDPIDPPEPDPPPCTVTDYYVDDDGDGIGDAARIVRACARPANTASRAGDNCPAVANPDQRDSDGDRLGDACDPTPLPGACQERSADVARWRVIDDSDAPAGTVAAITDDTVVGDRALRVTTDQGVRIRARAEGAVVDARGATALSLALRPRNTNSGGFQSLGLALEDDAGRRREVVVDVAGIVIDGSAWTRLDVPLSLTAGQGTGSDGRRYSAADEGLDLARLRAVEVTGDTWGGGFVLDIDGVFFSGTTRAELGAGCFYRCVDDCNGNGGCDVDTLSCTCALGARGASCEQCAEGWVADAEGRCALQNDGGFVEWPNPVSRANSDPWLPAHHDKIERVRPKVLVLNFDNGTTDAHADALVDGIIAGFAEGSRPRGYDDDQAAPQLLYERARSIVHLRDPGATSGNSSLYPRKGTPGTPSWGFDYARLFSAEMAARYGFVTSDGGPADLCTLVNTGTIHEVWVIVSPLDDAPMAEVLELKQRYDDVGNKIPGSIERCAGNGCFEAAVPFCGRSLRIGAINAGRGPGCFLHSQGHGMEGLARTRAVPAFSSWFIPFARFDLHTRYGLPIRDLYALRCVDGDGDGRPDRDCVRFSSATSATLMDGPRSFPLPSFDAGCGNVHFAPNSTWHYETMSDFVVQSSCEGFGRHEGALRADRLRPTSAARWAPYEQRFPDCGGGYLTWWMQNMPGHGSGQTFDDGTPMASAWPFLFY